MAEVIKTLRFSLRRLRPEDSGDLWALHNDPEVMRWINGGRPTARSLIKDEVLPAMLAYADGRPGIGAWVILKRERDEFLGWVSLRPLTEAPDTAELGYRLHRSVWGRGVATEAAQAIIEAAFSPGGVQRITANTYEHNTGSIRVMEKLGMSLVRRFRYEPENMKTAAGEPVELWPGDDVEFEILKPPTPPPSFGGRGEPG